MRFFHLSDLHIGKQLHEYSLFSDQEYILRQILTKAEEYEPDAVLICGDIYDKTVPAGEAYEIFDRFLMGLSGLHIPVLIIAGNHDSPKRLSYASSFLEKHQIFISTMPPRSEDEYLKKITLSDSYGPVNFYLLPFTKPAYVRHLFSEGQVFDYDSGIRELLNRETIDENQRNVILSHQFYQASDWMTKTCDSEQVILSVGGTDRVDAALLRSFDYAALGHLHGSQRVKFPGIRYCGSPLKYSISEEHHKKSITLVTLKEKGCPAEIEEISLSPLRDVKTLRGKLEEILNLSTDENRHNFVSVLLTDDIDPIRPKEKLCQAFDFLLDYRIDNQRTRSILTEQEHAFDHLTPIEAFCAFYEEIHKIPLTEEQRITMEQMMEEVKEDEE